VSASDGAMVVQTWYWLVSESDGVVVVQTGWSGGGQTGTGV